jgi:hypothetical protein
VITLQPETLRAWARNAAPAFLALYLVSNLMLRSFTDVWMFIGWTALCSGIICGGWEKGPRTIFWGVLALLFCHAAAIPGSLIWGTGNWELTAGVVLWMAPAMLLYLATNAHQVFVWLIPAWLFHATLVIIEGFTHWNVVGDVMVRQGTNTGLANNPNLAAGFLAIGIVYLMASKRPALQALSLPLVVALLFTGSRWGIVVPVAVIGIMALSGTIPWKVLAGGVLALLLTVMGGGLIGAGYQIAGYGSITGALNPIVTDVGIRLAVPHLPSFLPYGVAEHPGLHSVPLRIAVENGIIAAGIWVAITAWALVPRAQVQPIYRWLLLSLVLLSILDYYTWMGHLGGFWWLLIGLLTKRPIADK